MIYVFYTLFILSCIALIVSVLLQPGKADAGALFTSSVSSNAFGPRGTQTILAKITIGAAIAFMLSALMLSQPAITGTRSVFQGASLTDTNSNTATAETTDANTANANVAAPETNVNAANVAPVNANVAAATDKKEDKKADVKKEEPKKEAANK